MVRLAVFTTVLPSLVLALSRMRRLLVVALVLHVLVRPATILTVAIASPVLVILALGLIVLVIV